MLNGPGVAWLWLLGCGILGLVTAFLFVSDHAVLHRGALPSGEVDRRGLADRTGDQHHRGLGGGHGDAGAAGAGDLGGAAAELLLRGCRDWLASRA